MRELALATATLLLACKATAALISCSSLDDFEVDCCEFKDSELSDGESSSGLRNCSRGAGKDLEGGFTGPRVWRFPKVLDGAVDMIVHKARESFWRLGQSCQASQVMCQGTFAIDYPAGLSGCEAM